MLWLPIRDGDDRARALYRRHYSAYHYADGRRPRKFTGPGQYMALLTADCLALWVWRKFIDASGQQGINCAIFRNESPILSSTLITEAEELANTRWPRQRFYTYVNPRAIRSTNPGYCFKIAGWSPVGYTAKRHYLILAKEPPP